MPASPGLSSYALAISWALSPPKPTGVSNMSAISQTSSPGGPPVYLLEDISCAFDSFRLFVASTVIACGGRVIRWRADKGGEYTSEAFKQYYLVTGITQEFEATNTPQKMACPRELAGPFAVWFAAFSSTLNSRPSCGGSSCSLRLNSATVCHPPGLTWRRRSSGLYGKGGQFIASQNHLR